VPMQARLAAAGLVMALARHGPGPAADGGQRASPRMAEVHARCYIQVLYRVD
jgi:hypothetical protein